MTTKRLSSRRTRLEKNHAKVVAALVHGKNQSEVATEFKVSQEAVSKFVERHATEISEITAVVDAQITDYAIASKVNRIRDAQAEYNDLEEWVAERGLSEVIQRFDKDGNVIGESVRLRKDYLDSRRAIRREVAEELGALPRPDQNINLRAQVLVRQIEGTDTESIG